jgi:hypothetical protein
MNFISMREVVLWEKPSPHETEEQPREIKK